jgi:hypothetical protein
MAAVTARMHSTTEVCRRERCRRKRSNVDNASSGVASGEGSYRRECCVTRFLFSTACNKLAMLLCRLSSSSVTIDAFVPWDEASRSDDRERASGSSSSHSMVSSSSSSLGLSCGKAMARPLRSQGHVHASRFVYRFRAMQDEASHLMVAQRAAGSVSAAVARC